MLNSPRNIALRVVYLGQDRLDSGGLAKTVAIPREGDNERLSRSAHGTNFRKKQTQLSCPRMLIGPHVAKHVVQIQVAL